MEKLKLLFDRKRSNIYLLKNILFALLLCVIVILIDYDGALHEYIPEFFLTKIDVSRTILGSLGGTFLTITTFTFSTILTVLSSYSSNFTPRVVNNFLSNDITMKVLGLFVGGFIYSMVSLFFMKSTNPDAMVISSTVALLYSMICIFNFVKFIFSVSESIQMTNVIKEVFHESEDVINEFAEQFEEDRRVESYDVSEYDQSHPFFANANGYLELIDFDPIIDKYKEEDCAVVIFPQKGDFISENEVIGKVYTHGKTPDKEFLEDLSDMCSLQNERLVRNDYRFAIQKLVEITLRALSTGVNDPNTAINCLRYLGVLFGKLGTIYGSYTVQVDDEYPLRAVAKDFSMKDDLYDLVSPIVHYGQADLSVAIAILECLKIAKRVSIPSNQKHIDEFAEYAMNKFRENYTYSNDTKRLEDAYYLIEHINEIKAEAQAKAEAKAEASAS